MSELTATNCGCGCDNGCANSCGCGGNGNGCGLNNSCLWIILLLCCCGGWGGNGCGGCGNGCGNDSCLWRMLISVPSSTSNGACGKTACPFWLIFSNDSVFR